MAGFDFEYLVNESSRLDVPLQHGPLMRWQRKAMENGIRALCTDMPDGGNGSLLQVPRSARTPTPRTPMTASPSRPNMSKTPNRDSTVKGKTPKGKTPGKGKTPNKTPSHVHLDRFIPNRAAMNAEVSHHSLVSGDAANGDTTEHQERMRQALGQQADVRILSFKQKPPHPNNYSANHLHVLYSASSSSNSVSKSSEHSRHIPQHADRVLDAPDLRDDYYLNLLSWSRTNLLAIALGTGMYTWNAASGEIGHVMELTEPNDYISSVAWGHEGNIVAIGNSSGCVQLWDVSHQKLLRTMSGHTGRVGSLAWLNFVLTSGARSGAIHHHDVRVAAHHVATLAHHTQEVCGLQWSHDGRHLASGANDNVLCVWDAAFCGPSLAPVHAFSQHQAAVKGVAWCPWQASLLASGGGTADRQIRLWNINTGACVNSMDTGSQVSSLLWSDTYHELVSGHGYAQNQLTIWKYPALTRVTDLLGHGGRVLSLALSPDGSTVASAAADQSISLWLCFAMDKDKKAAAVAKAKRDRSPGSILERGIR